MTGRIITKQKYFDLYSVNKLTGGFLSRSKVTAGRDAYVTAIRKFNDATSHSVSHSQGLNDSLLDPAFEDNVGTLMIGCETNRLRCTAQRSE